MAGSQNANLVSIPQSQKSKSTSSGAERSEGKEGGKNPSEDSSVSGPEAGVGTTNEEGDSYAVQKGHGTKDRLSKNQSQWQEEFIRLYKPMRLGGLNAKDEYVKGNLKLEKGMKEITAPLEPTPVKPETELKNILAEYTETQKDSIRREEIPNYYKKCVQNYFDSIH
jgi:hypothetical protein